MSLPKITCLILMVMACALLFSTPSSAADDSQKGLGGFYIGVLAGYGTGSYTSAINNAVDHEPSGGLFGGKAGFSHVAGSLMVGIEGDVSYSAIDGEDTITLLDYKSDLSHDVTMLSTIRGRVGGVFGNAMVYGTAGVAFGRVDNAIRVTFHGLEVGSDTQTSSHTGWTAGVGLEYAASERISFGGEYLRVDMSPEEIVMDIGGYKATDKGDLNLNTFRFGLNIHF